MRIIVILFIQLALLMKGLCVVVQRVSASDPVLAGQTVKLECLWSAGSGPPLYSLRWCKDGHQFFAITLVPRRNKISFPLEGVNVVLSTSDEYSVSLTNASSATSGTYTCEAMSDKPYFLSSARSVSISVIEVPISGPNWRGVLSVYHVEQKLHAHCHVAGSRPPANFSFWINDYHVQENEWIIQHVPQKETTENLWNSSSTLIVPLSASNIQKFLHEKKESHNPQITLSADDDSYHNLQRHSYESNRRNIRWSTRSTVLPGLQPSSFSSFSFSISRNKRDYESKPSILMLPPAHERSTRVSSSQRRLLSWSGDNKDTKLNLTCIANVGGIPLHTNAKSIITFPKEPEYNSIKVLLKGTGSLTSHSYYLSSAALVIIVIHMFMHY
ncbi:uncharacterized protein [Macrobrachium rosenbergii]|uniref:uncharacterized protein n=1 Tax=Macrobrachium rosenbergii TaxID=79674 RepID=UPI0034D4B2B1